MFIFVGAKTWSSARAARVRSWKKRTWSSAARWYGSAAWIMHNQAQVAELEPGHHDPLSGLARRNLRARRAPVPADQAVPLFTRHPGSRRVLHEEYASPSTYWRPHLP